ncbi:post-PEP-CTERM-1 domain-containing protein [Undibacterium sp. TJN25]|uniref:post-PEP-CTERM-1 domain-containing protein n=1 Tax=Undibacterium sp. TJN25 TaxID=3413056 RepID=UPI003BF21654
MLTYKQLFLATAVVSALAATTAVQAQDSGMRVFKDPVTGQLRAPTAEESAALDAQDKAVQASKSGRQATQARAKRAVAVVRPDGSKTMALDESFMTYSVATRNADGTLGMECVTGEEAAEKLMSAAPSATASAKATKFEEHHHEEK